MQKNSRIVGVMQYVDQGNNVDGIIAEGDVLAIKEANWDVSA